VRLAIALAPLAAREPPDIVTNKSGEGSRHAGMPLTRMRKWDPNPPSKNVAQTKEASRDERWISNRRDITVGVSSERKGIIKAARLTSEMVLSMRTVSDAEQYRSAFVVDPATGALEIRAELRPKIERALRRDTYLHALRSYLHLSSIDSRLLFAECADALSRTARYLVCKVSEFLGNIHGAPPFTTAILPVETASLYSPKAER
jgi:hypothetical protein